MRSYINPETSHMYSTEAWYARHKDEIDELYSMVKRALNCDAPDIDEFVSWLYDINKYGRS